MKKPRKSRRIPLSDAYWHFAPKRLINELHELQSQPKKLPKVSDDKIENIKNLFTLGGTLFDELFIAKPPLRKMAKHLIQQLGRERLEAWGVLTKPTLAQEPQRIAAFIFKGNPKIHWNNCTIENLGRKFEIVEICRPGEISHVLHKPMKTAKGRPGRPRVDDKIMEVVRELDRRHMFEGKLEKERVALVQGQCRSQYSSAFPRESQPSRTKVREILKQFNHSVSGKKIP